jgi:cell division protein FtsZ
MAQGKRASMREGPLADLFRKTEQDDAPAKEPAASAPEERPAGDAQARTGKTQAATGGSRAAAGEAQTAAAGERAAESRSSRESETPDPAPRVQPELESKPEQRQEPGAGQRGDSRAQRRSESRVQLDSQARQEQLGETEEEETPRVPSPRERLRNVFSAEIPANMMESAAGGEIAASSARSSSPAVSRTAKAPPPEAPEVDVYAREEPRQLAAPQAGGSTFANPVIRVVGVGGAGVNAVNRMVEAEVAGVEFLAINTDLQSLQQSTADITLHIGAELTRGLGSGSDTSLGRQAAMDDYDRAKALLKGSDMIFITAGAGGGTGTGAAPIVARIAREVGALAVAIVTKPFGFEGSRRAEQAEEGVRALAEEVDTLIVVPNNRLLSVLDKQTSMVDAFRIADDVLRQGVQGISDLVTLPGLINLDFADVRTIMSGAGNALLGIGMGAGGEHRATEAAMQAVSSPLLETSMEGARSILLSITGGRDLSLWEVNEAAKAVSEAAHPDANIIFGAMVDEKLEDQVWVTVVATGYGSDRDSRSAGRSGETGRPREAASAGGRAGERDARAGAGRRERRGGLAVDELEVPEFMPRV